MKNKILVELVAKQTGDLIKSNGHRMALVALGKWIEATPYITDEELNYLMDLVKVYQEH